MEPQQHTKSLLGYTYERYNRIGNDGLLGEGGNAKVYLVKNTFHGELVAVKEILVRKRETPDELGVLLTILKRNDRICNLKDYAEPILQPFPWKTSDRKGHLVKCSMVPLYMEYCECGDLWAMAHRYREHDEIIPEGFILHVFKQVAEALAFIHWGYDVTGSAAPRRRASWRQVLHRDIKVENAFMTYRGDYSKKYPDIVLGDFGAATPLDWKDAMQDKCCGTAVYQAPEACSGQEEPPVYSTKSDVWGLGTIIYSLCTRGAAPVMDYPEGTEWDFEFRQEWDSDPHHREVKDITEYGYSSMLNDCVSMALEIEPDDRLDSFDMLQYLNKLAENEPFPTPKLEKWAIKVPDFVSRKESNGGILKTVSDS